MPKSEQQEPADNVFLGQPPEPLKKGEPSQDSSAGMSVKDGDGHVFDNTTVRGGGYPTGIRIEGGKNQNWKNTFVSGSPKEQIPASLVTLIEKLRDIGVDEADVSSIESRALKPSLNAVEFSLLINETELLIAKSKGES